MMISLFSVLSVGVPPKLVTPLEQVMVRTSQTAVMECTIKPGEPKPEIRW
jgi:hypothetical protein